MKRRCHSSVLWLILLYSFIKAVHCDCGPPPTIPFGRLKQEFADQETFAVASAVKYDCLPGFIRVPGAKNHVTCMENSIWTSNEEFCKLRSCGFPGETENGYFEARNFYFNSRVTYYCDMGYFMISKRNYRYCQADGTWSNSVPTCEEVNCGPPNVPHSKKLLGFVGPYSLNSLIRFQCLEGFKMEGSDTIVCNMDSTWEPSPPECKRAFCPEPKLLHGKVLKGRKNNGYNVYDAVTLACDPYYKLNGASKVTCGKDFQWYPALPTCKWGLCPNPIIINGSITQVKKNHGYRMYSSIMFTCNSGYKLKGENKLTCETNLEWSEEFPICERKDGCRSPKIANGRVTKKNSIHYDPEIHGHGFSTSDEIEIACDNDYRLSGSSKSKCVYQRTIWYFTYEYVWLPTLPTCEK
ncbi:C4b-binding protein-like isoform X2 [Pyxicephalus adspersus]|uniref:C4b-binding protein-like isoform X2 n=1 Tax=Pyxicephalus adspersus TaxID=30357 RepID=UPI003B593A31